MTNMRRGFTMIELVFVIVIIGILAAVALPKMVGTANEAHNANVKSFVGTLNRTVGPTLWSKSLADGAGGAIASANYCGNIGKYTEIPKELDQTDITSSNDCNSTQFDINESTGATGTIILLHDGNATDSPKWTYTP